MKASDYIWYAGYGSNLCYDRFMCYIKGGIPAGSSKSNIGCRDNSSPLKSSLISIQHELFFAHESKSWGGGGVAFIDPFKKSENTNTICRGYLITRQQFADIVRQENDIQTEINIDVSKAIDIEVLKVGKNGWYSIVVFLGYYNEIPVFTITCDQPLPQINMPSEQYLRTIVSGLKEITDWGASEIVGYLSIRKGVRDFYSIESIQQIVISEI